MKHESNDTPPFAPDDPISRSLFVRPSLIERLCASALRLCLLVCIPAAASVFLISLADSAEAACTSEPSQHYEVTTLIADHPVQTSSDPDFEEILKANARIAVESGEWSRRVKRKEETLIQWMRSFLNSVRWPSRPRSFADPRVFRLRTSGAPSSSTT